MGAGLPNIQGTLTGSASQVVPPTGSESGALYTSTKTVTQYISLGGSSASRKGGIVSFDASKSNSIYGNSDTVQSQTTKYYFYIVIGTVTKTDLLVDIDNIAVLKGHTKQCPVFCLFRSQSSRLYLLGSAPYC